MDNITERLPKRDHQHFSFSDLVKSRKRQAYVISVQYLGLDIWALIRVGLWQEKRADDYNEMVASGSCFQYPWSLYIFQALLASQLMHDIERSSLLSALIC